jgi:hypothetical protein
MSELTAEPDSTDGEDKKNKIKWSTRQEEAGRTQNRKPQFYVLLFLYSILKNP